MTFGLETGGVQGVPLPAALPTADLGKDPLTALENWTTLLVVALVVVLLVVGAIGVLAVVRAALG